MWLMQVRLDPFWFLEYTGCDQSLWALGADGHASGWPGLIPARLRGKTTEEAKEYTAFSAYFDAVNLARRITCPTIMAVGLIDDCCNPGTVFAAYNEIRAPKRIFTGPGFGHGTCREFGVFFDKWMPGMWGQTEKMPLTPGTEKKDDGTPPE